MNTSNYMASEKNSKKKEVALSCVYISLIATITFALVLIFFPVPMKARMNNKLDEDILIKQH